MDRKIQSIVAILLFALTIYLLVILLSYDPEDPGWSGAMTGYRAGPIDNLGGAIGATVSSSIYSLFGWASWLLFCPLISGIMWLMHRRPISSSPPLPLPEFVSFMVSRAIGALLILLSGAVLSSFFENTEKLQAGGAGGWLGSITAERLSVFGFSGQLIISIALLFVGLFLVSDMAWMRVVLWFFAKIAQGLSYLWRGFKKMVTGLGLALWYLLLSPLLLQRYLHLAWQRRRAPARSRARAPKKPLPGAPDQSKDGETSSPATATAAPAKPTVPPAKSATIPASGTAAAEAEAVVASSWPDINLLTPPAPVLEDEIEWSDRSQQLQQALKHYDVEAEVMDVMPGPVVTRFELQPSPGLKISKVVSAATDLARTLSVTSLRIVEIIEGKNYFGMEIPNQNRQQVALASVLQSQTFRSCSADLPLTLGVNIVGEAVVSDLATMPHLLMAGATGAGKSVGIHAIIAGMLFKCSPEQLRLVLVDPKRLEFSLYENLPHLMAPVVTDPGGAAAALSWCVQEMENRYDILTAAGVRELSAYNRKMEAEGAGETQMLPRILVVIDELADLMMSAGKTVEQQIARIAQKARAAGIHLLLATQRPSVDVLTGLIKANIPARISFQVVSMVDSRTVLDQGGAQQLLGKGDMLFLPPGQSQPVRVHGAYTSEGDVKKIVQWWQQKGAPDWLERRPAFSSVLPAASGGNGGADVEEDGLLYERAVEYVRSSGKTSVSAVQRHLRIGFNRASRLVDMMEQQGVLSVSDARGLRHIVNKEGDI